MKLVIDNLLKKYDEKIAVEKISFEVNQGETIGILGPNGAGKTTLFYMIAGLISPDSGNILLGDEKLNTESISRRTSLGLSYLPQESSIFRGLTVEYNILSSLEQRKDLNPKERIAIGKAGRAFVRKNFDSKLIFQCIEDYLLS